MKILLAILFSVTVLGQTISSQFIDRRGWWEPPLGCPYPSFGVTNLHYMFDADTGLRNPDLTYTTDDEFGPYTHYVDKYRGGTDSGRPFGTRAAPRATIPEPLPFGSLVRLMGSSNRSENPYNYSGAGPGNRVYIYSTNASPTQPVFVYGISTNNEHRPWFGYNGTSDEMNVGGDNVILVNICFTNTSVSGRADLKGAPITNVVFRDFFSEGRSNTGDPNVIFGFPGSGSTESLYANHILFLGGEVCRYGDYTDDTYNDDETAFILGDNSWWTYNYDNRVYHMGGDASRVGRNVEALSGAHNSGYHFIGRLTAQTNKENAVDFKQATNVVVSDSLFEGFDGANDDPGSAITIHYNPYSLFILNNRIRNSNFGISNNSTTPDTNYWVVGNTFEGIVETALDPNNGSGRWNLWNNTIVDCNDGIDAVRIDARNNLIVGSTNLTLRVSDSTHRTESTVLNHLIFSPSISISWGTTYSSVASWIAGTTVGDGSIQTDPLFSDSDFNLSAESPARDAGYGDFSALETAFLARFGYALNYRDMNGTAVSDGMYVGAVDFDDGGEEPPPEEDATRSLIIQGSQSIQGAVTIQ